MISLKKYLEMEVPQTPERSDPVKERAAAAGGDTQARLLAAAVGAFRASLVAMARSGAQAYPAVSSELEASLGELERRLGGELSPAGVQETGEQARESLQRWAGRASEYFKQKANDVKELMLVLSRTADSVGERDQRYTTHLTQLTARLQSVSDLDDLGRMRASLVEQATELRSCVYQMTEDSHRLVTQLQSQVSVFETRLKAVEELSLRDSLTGLANRRGVADRIGWHIERQRPFCVAIMDLNRFKSVNDEHGHVAGDNLLKQFAQELRSNSRSGDIAGRWGGDEFILVLDCDLAGARMQLERTQKWVLGDYTIDLGNGREPIKTNVQATTGLAEWRPGESADEVIQRADAAMYAERKRARAQGA